VTGLMRPTGTQDTSRWISAMAIYKVRGMGACMEESPRSALPDLPYAAGTAPYIRHNLYLIVELERNECQ